MDLLLPPGTLKVVNWENINDSEDVKKQYIDVTYTSNKNAESIKGTKLYRS